MDSPALTCRKHRVIPHHFFLFLLRLPLAVSALPPELVVDLLCPTAVAGGDVVVFPPNAGAWPLLPALALGVERTAGAFGEACGLGRATPAVGRADGVPNRPLGLGVVTPELGLGTGRAIGVFGLVTGLGRATPAFGVVPGRVNVGCGPASGVVAGTTAPGLTLDGAVGTRGLAQGAGAATPALDLTPGRTFPGLVVDVRGLTVGAGPAGLIRPGVLNVPAPRFKSCL